MQMTSSTESLVEALDKSRTRASRLKPPSEAGIYAVYLRSGVTLGSLPAGREGLIYLGSSSDLRQRDLETHFGDKGSSLSTLRRSLGAILRDDLNLSAIPCTPGPSYTKLTSYKFDPDGEERLTKWMAENLEVGFCLIDDGYADLARSLIEELEPILNLREWNNPYRRQIKRLRRLFADEARVERSAAE
jgi:hypothetical protein